MSAFHDLPSDEQVRAELAIVRASVLETTRHVRSPRRSTRYRTTRAVILAAAIAVALTAGTIAATRASQVQIGTTATCFEHPDLDSRQRVIYTSGADGQPLATFDPIEVCGLVWTNDSWTGVSNNDPDDPNDGDAPIPPLVACVLPDGSAGVFPREGDTGSPQDFCVTLGLADWDSD
ncbi:MAG: hypothetical protein ABI566_04645 [Pseudolysinimonas sp.]